MVRRSSRSEQSFARCRVTRSVRSPQVMRGPQSSTAVLAGRYQLQSLALLQPGEQVWLGRDLRAGCDVAVRVTPAVEDDESPRAPRPLAAATHAVVDHGATADGWLFRVFAALDAAVGPATLPARTRYCSAAAITDARDAAAVVCAVAYAELLGSQGAQPAVANHVCGLSQIQGCPPRLKELA